MDEIKQTTGKKDYPMELSKQIVQEGNVLVRNDGDILPLDIEEDSKVNVFG